MRVKIGPYKDHYTVYKLTDRVVCWKHKVDHRWLVDDEDLDWVDNCVDRVGDFIQDILNSTINKLRSKRKVEIKVDSWDTWSADHTLALIIHPVLKQLRDTKHGSPYVEPEDVPESLRPDPGRHELYAQGKIEYHEIDDTLHDRWNWVMDEMVWAFSMLKKDDWTEDFYSTPPDGSNEYGKFDAEAHQAADMRIKNGLLMFAKYYHGLWD